MILEETKGNAGNRIWTLTHAKRLRIAKLTYTKKKKKKQKKTKQF